MYNISIYPFLECYFMTSTISYDPSMHVKPLSGVTVLGYDTPRPSPFRPLIELELAKKASTSAVTRRSDWYPNLKFQVNR